MLYGIIIQKGAISIKNTNKNYRQNRFFLRNEYVSDNLYGIPNIKKQEIDLSNLKMLACNKIKQNDIKNADKTIHFFKKDSDFESYYHFPEKKIVRLAQYYCLLTPDYSLYPEMPLALQIYNTFRNRWCGAFWQEHHLNVIPTVSWSNEHSYKFAFLGIEKKSIVAISTVGIIKNKNDTRAFIKGYESMLDIINPKKIICYGEPCQELNSIDDNSLIFVPHELKEVS